MDFRGEKGAACKKGREGLIKSGLKRARVRKDAFDAFRNIRVARRNTHILCVAR